MPKSQHKFECVVCNKTLSASTFLRHLRANTIIHKEILDSLEAHRILLANETHHCKHCKKEIQHDFTMNDAMMSLFSNERSNIRKTCSKKCKNLPWNTGLTKENNESLQRMSKSRTGKQNPIFKVLADEDLRKKWIHNVVECRAIHDESRRGKTIVEFLGVEKAEIIKTKMSKSAKLRKINGHTGCKHTVEARLKIGAKTVKWMSEKKIKTSIPQKELFDFLCKNLSECLILEHIVGHYSVDIAIPEIRLAIEVDGDFFHANSNEGYEIKYDIQKRNVRNDKRKNEYLVNAGWDVIRFWVSDIKKDIQWILQTINHKIISMRSLT